MRTCRARVAAAAVAGLLGAAGVGPVHAQPVETQSDSSGIESIPAKIVVLVDLSGTLSPADVAAERDAASLVVQSEFSPGSELSVVGFGSDNGKPGQSPVDTICETTMVGSGHDRDYLASCVQDIRPRTYDEGNDTDFVAATQQALSILGTGGDEPKIILLMTDGELDVRNSPRYGDNEAEREATATRQLAEEIARAREGRVQIWPLGFGSEINHAQLADFAEDAYRGTCNPDSPAPEPRIADSPADVVTTLLAAFAAARCAVMEPPESRELAPGGTVDLPVTVPAIATDGSITVIKRDERIRVDYYDPAGNLVPKAGTVGESQFEVSGESTGVEVLRIRNPAPGTWQVRLRSAAGVAAQDVTATVLWQGVVRASITLDPPQPMPGEPVTVYVTIETRVGAVDPAALAGLTVTARMSGDDLPSSAVPLNDDGAEVDARSGDGEYTGQVTVPAAASGALQFVGQVAGPGILTNERPANATIGTGRALFVAISGVPTGERVTPGATVSGQLNISNQTGTAVTLRLLIDGAAPGTLATVSPSRVEVPDASGTIELAFELAFDPRNPRGHVQLPLRVVDDSDPEQVYAERVFPFLLDDPPPPLLERLRPWGVAALCLLALGLVVATIQRARARSAERDVRGLTVLLYRDGRQLNYLAAPELPAHRFRFQIRDDPETAPRLDTARPDDDAYEVSRSPAGGFRLRTPQGQRLQLRTGHRAEITGGLELEIRDDRTDPEGDAEQPVGSAVMPDIGRGSPPPAGSQSGSRQGVGTSDDLLW